MAVPPEIESALALEDFEAVENRWLELMEEDASRIDLLARIAEELAGAGDGSRAGLLLGLLDDQLKDSDPGARMQLLRVAGRRLFSGRELHGEILSTLEALYADQGQLGALMEALRLRTPGRTPADTWEKVDRLERLILLEPGTIVWMEGKGVGTIAEVNLALQSLKVDFERIKGLGVGFKIATKVLEPLPDGHILRRKLEDPEVLRRQARENGAEILRAVLESFARPLTAGEIREALSGVVADKSWTSWWSSARQHPQVLVNSGARPTYAWAATGDAALESVAADFEAADLTARLEIFRRQASRDTANLEEMAAALHATAEAQHHEDPAMALRIWTVLEKAGRAPQDAAWGLTRLVDERTDFTEVLANLDARADRQRLLEAIRRQRDDWADVFQAQILIEEDPRLLDLMASELAEEAPEVLWTTLDGVMTMPARNATTFVWLAERAADDESLAARQPALLLRQILKAFAGTAFSDHRARLSALIESGGTVPRLLDYLDVASASKARRDLEEAQLPDATRAPLINALELRFPDLRTQGESPLYATPKAIEQRKRELRILLEEEIPANRRAIQEARELGDLRENFEYKSARQRHEYLSARSAGLARDLERVHPIDIENLDLAEIRIGTRVELTRSSGNTEYTILGPWESDPDRGVISYESELAGDLLGRGVGDTVTVAGSVWKVGAIRPATIEA